ncbi:MAG: hypothetical protein RI894_1765 [Bacteroidota bacterium]|jgi:hypothetical protein
MKLIFFIAGLLPLAAFAQVKNAVPPPPPPKNVPPPPPLPPLTTLADTTKPLKLRTKKIEVIVDDTRNGGKIETDDKDVNINAGNARVIIRKRKKGDGNPDNELQVGERRIIIKKDGNVDSTNTPDVKIIRRKKGKDGEVIVIDGDEAEKEMGKIDKDFEAIMAEIGKEMGGLGEEMDGIGKELDVKGKELDVLGKEMEKNAGNQAEQQRLQAKMQKIQQEMDVLQKQMEPKSHKMDKLGKKMEKITRKMEKKIEIHTEDGDEADSDTHGDTHEDNSEKMEKKVEIKIGDSDSHHDGKAKIKNRFIMFDFGVNGFAQKGSLNLTGDATPLELYYGKSFMYRIGAFRQRIPLDKNGTVNLMWGANFEMDNYEFSRPITLQKNSDPLAIVTDNSQSFSKNRLYTSWAEVPLMLHFETNRKASKSFRIGIGAQGGLMLGSLTDQCDNSTDKNTKVESGFNLNKVRYGLQAQLGYGPVNFVAQYHLSPLFQAGKAPEVNTFNVGFSIVPF